MAPVEEVPVPQQSGAEGGLALSTHSRKAGTPHPDSMMALPFTLALLVTQETNPSTIGLLQPVTYIIGRFKMHLQGPLVL